MTDFYLLIFVVFNLISTSCPFGNFPSYFKDEKPDRNFGGFNSRRDAFNRNVDNDFDQGINQRNTAFNSEFGQRGGRGGMFGNDDRFIHNDEPNRNILNRGRQRKAKASIPQLQNLGDVVSSNGLGGTELSGQVKHVLGAGVNNDKDTINLQNVIPQQLASGIGGIGGGGSSGNSQDLGMMGVVNQALQNVDISHIGEKEQEVAHANFIHGGLTNNEQPKSLGMGLVDNLLENVGGVANHASSSRQPEVAHAGFIPNGLTNNEQPKGLSIGLVDKVLMDVGGIADHASGNRQLEVAHADFIPGGHVTSQPDLSMGLVDRVVLNAGEITNRASQSRQPEVAHADFIPGMDTVYDKHRPVDRASGGLQMNLAERTQEMKQEAVAEALDGIGPASQKPSLARQILDGRHIK